MNNLRWLKVFILFVIVFALQGTVVDWLRFMDVGPDLVVVFIVAVAIRLGPAAGCSGDSGRALRRMCMLPLNGSVQTPFR